VRCLGAPLHKWGKPHAPPTPRGAYRVNPHGEGGALCSVGARVSAEDIAPCFFPLSQSRALYLHPSPADDECGGHVCVTSAVCLCLCLCIYVGYSVVL
jgi:hypothetical protein